MAVLSARFARVRGFTLVEMMVVVAIISILAVIAVPQFLRYQLRAKSAEVRTNLSAIHVVSEVYYSEQGRYVSAAPEPTTVPGTQKANFDAAGSDFAELGWKPESDVYFSYGVAVNADGSAFTADGGADIDGDGIVQFWGYAKPQSNGTKVPAKVGCDVTGLTDDQVGPCSSGAGSAIF